LPTFRGITPVAHARNMRLDRASEALGQGEASVAEIAGRFGFAAPRRSHLNTASASAWRRAAGSARVDEALDIRRMLMHGSVFGLCGGVHPIAGAPPLVRPTE
jgi:hypothetical protein